VNLGLPLRQPGQRLGAGIVRTVAYVPAGRFRRTDLERRDEHLSWERPDQAFFAAGACHILAWTFIETYPDAGYGIVAARLECDEHCFHAYVSNGTWAFDHAGWNLEADLLSATEEFEKKAVADRWTVLTDLKTYCRDYDHRPPEAYYADPRPRAQTYLASFPAPHAR
jgi:hypothetical protein